MCATITVVSSDDRSDLVSEMYALVREQAPLHEVTHEVRDLVGGTEVVHGPWRPSDCRSVLQPWHRAGWLELVADVDPPSGVRHAPWHDRARRVGAYWVLAEADARALLGDDSRWVLGTADGHVMLSLTDEGARHDLSEWSSRVERTG